MDYKRAILSMLKEISSPEMLEKIYWFIQRLIVR